MLFVRNYPRFLGGHLKVFDYLAHVAASGIFEPQLYLVPGSVEPNAALVASSIRRTAEISEADAYFVGGFNWNMLDLAGIDTARKPVVNLIQSMVHAKPDHPKFGFLARPALRICVSSPIAEALAAISCAVGPIVTIPNGIDLAYIAQFIPAVKEDRVFIAGAKNATMAQAIASALKRQGIAVDACNELIARDMFLKRMASCATAIVLPHQDEGFYLPALEAMALGTAVVIPHLVGPASYCIDGETCVTTDYSTHALCAGAILLRENRDLRMRLYRDGRKAAEEHSLLEERCRFNDVLYRYVSEHDHKYALRREKAP